MALHVKKAWGKIYIIYHSNFHPHVKPNLTSNWQPHYIIYYYSQKLKRCVQVPKKESKEPYKYLTIGKKSLKVQ